MIHPDTELRFINEAVGYGVFATQPIPKGTIVFVKDPLDIELSEAQVNQLHPSMQAAVEKYSYIDEHGKRIVSWDHAKFVNHCCQCNAISTGYGFEIAIRDIAVGEEITDEYGLFNLQGPMPVSCPNTGCRRWVKPRDVELFADTWDHWILDALKQLNQVSQPLIFLLTEAVQDQLQGFLRGRLPYLSVRALLFSSRLNESLLNDPNVAA